MPGAFKLKGRLSQTGVRCGLYDRAVEFEISLPESENADEADDKSQSEAIESAPTALPKWVELPGRCSRTMLLSVVLGKADAATWEALSVS
jgi:hypothetical protein